MTRVVSWVGSKHVYDDPKTKGSRRRVPLTADTTSLLRDYLAIHPRREEPTAPLFPGVMLVAGGWWLSGPLAFAPTRPRELNPAVARKPYDRPPPWPT